MVGMNVIAIITARWNSKRLPGKALKLIGDKEVIRWCYDTLKPICNDVVVATTETSKPIVDYCINNDMSYFVSTGLAIDEEDLIKRMHLCGEKYHPDVVIRIWGDCPFIIGDHIKETLAGFINSDYEYLYPDKCPNGLKYSIYKERAFKRLYMMMTEGDRWHWNLVDELTGWQKYGFSIDIHDFGMGHLPIKLKGLNINTQQDLDDANELIKTGGIYGLSILQHG
jgi:spore coat polysaccharide biosynthesis protein SpsF (cytidylyltransferase family)